MGLTVEEIVFLQKGIKESENYVVHVGIVPGDKVPQYLIFHKQYGVLEYAHNMIFFINEALPEMEEKLRTQAEGEVIEEATEAAEKPRRTRKKRVVN